MTIPAPWRKIAGPRRRGPMSFAPPPLLRRSLLALALVVALATAGAGCTDCGEVDACTTGQCAEDADCPWELSVCMRSGEDPCGICVACKPGAEVACVPANLRVGDLCRKGRKKCDRHGRWGNCDDYLQKGEELCNGKDDDCNGKVDDVPGLGGPCSDPSRAGSCRQGTWVCQGARKSCKQSVSPTAETCNGEDDDCNGKVDDLTDLGKPCEEKSRSGVCRPGVWACEKGKKLCRQSVQPQPESCNGKDDDCNGTVDDHPERGKPCTDPKRTGACREGVWACVGGALSCTQTVKPGTETCNGVDDDCDGATDDIADHGKPCTDPARKGICAPGRWICEKGKRLCKQSTLAEPEVCNGRDDDCNGLVDDLVDLGKPCTDFTRKGVCQPGKIACRAAGRYCKQSVQASSEVCNGKDDDCDGLTDEDSAGQPLTRACYTGSSGKPGVGECKAGRVTCVAGNWSGDCRGEVGPAAEVCNGKDDNCDGKVDEGLTTACYEGPVATRKTGECRDGTRVCTSGKWGGPCSGEVRPVAEACNGKDDDCDGKVDDGPLCSPHEACVSGKCVDTGCADGTREGLFDVVKFPKVAVCGGQWTHGNLRATRSGTPCTGTPASPCKYAEDICAPGWQICLKMGDPTELSGRMTAVECANVGAGAYLAAADHCTRERPCSYAKPLPCRASGYCTEAICCGKACRKGDCTDAVWPGGTMAFGNISNGCANTSMYTYSSVTGVICCK